jgi:PAS domain S-box-containing protein
LSGPEQPHPEPVHPPSQGELSTGRLLVFLGPALAAGAFTSALAALAALFDWHRHEMLVAAVGIGLPVLLVALWLVYRQFGERQVARQAMQDIQARVGGIVDSAMDPIISVDEDQRIVLFNAAAEKVFRWPREAVLGQPLDVLLPERLRGGHRSHMERFSHTGVTSRRMGDKTVLTGLRASGEEFPIEASISQHNENDRKLFTVILRDVTERMHAEQLLARNEARLRDILDSAMDAIITVDENGHVALFNLAAERVFGWPREQALGAPLEMFLPERFRAGHAGLVRQFGEAGDAPSRRMGGLRVVTGLRRNGEEFPIDASISHISEGGHRFYTVILRDVTERVQAEEALRRSREDLRDLASAANSVREQEKSRIARELHDELAQALTALKMDVSWVAERFSPGQEAVGAKLATMQTLLDSTVAATRRISADLRPLMLDDLGLVPAAEWLVQNFSQRTGIRCELAISAPDLELHDPHATAVFRILQESLTNVARHARATLVEITLDRNGDEVLLGVSDNGRGFATDDPRKPNSFGLMGLRERAYILGGEVAITSRSGRGTSVEVRIPLTKEGAGN